MDIVVFHQIGVIRADVHKRADVPAALAYGIALEELSDLVEKHYGAGLGVVAAPAYEGQCYGSHGGHCHQEVLVEDLTVQYALHGFAQNIIAHDQIGDHVEAESEPALRRQEVQDNDQHCRGNDPYEHFSLLIIHIFPLSVKRNCPAQLWQGSE